MKPLLRVLLIINAVVTLLLGLFFIATPWLPLYPPLAPFASSPGLIGQLFGVALLGLAWLAAHAAVDGFLTVPVTRVLGHFNWVSGAILLVWQVALHIPILSEEASFAVQGAGGILLIYGLIEVRLAGATHKRDKRLAAGARSAQRAEERARTTGALPTGPLVTPYTTGVRDDLAPVGPGYASATEPGFRRVDDPAYTSASRYDSAAAREAEAVREGSLYRDRSSLGETSGGSVRAVDEPVVPLTPPGEAPLVPSAEAEPGFRPLEPSWRDEAAPPYRSTHLDDRDRAVDPVIDPAVDPAIDPVTRRPRLPPSL